MKPDNARFRIAPDEALRRLGHGETIRRLLEDTMIYSGSSNIFMEYKLIGDETHFRVLGDDESKIWRKSYLKVEDMLKSKWYGESIYEKVGINLFW